MPLELLLNDEYYVALNKPTGLATIPGRGETTCAIEQLSVQLKLPCTGTRDPRLRVVHRIDKGTSGVLLLAKTIEAQRHASHQFQNNTITKEYLALVAGRPMESEGEIDAPIGVHPANHRLMSIGKHGRPALTLWKVESQFRDFALLRVFPKTGKTHQIRVHLRSIGLPLAIDELYNPLPPDVAPGLLLSSFKKDYREPSEGERPLIARLTLHAERLTFAHIDGRTIQIVAPLPKDFRATLTQLGKHGCS